MPCFYTVLPCLEEDYNTVTVVKKPATKELLLNFELELKKLFDDSDACILR